MPNSWCDPQAKRQPEEALVLFSSHRSSSNLALVLALAYLVHRPRGLSDVVTRDIERCTAMLHIFCLGADGVAGLLLQWHSLSDMFLDKSTEVPRRCISRHDKFPHFFGDLSDVYRCSMVSKSRGKIEVAIKSLRILDSNEEAIRTLRKRIHRDVRAWVALRHKNVLRFFGTTSGFGPLPAFVTPWMERGSLTNYLCLEFFNLSDREKFILLEQITTAIHYLHDNHVIHGNLTGNNILIDSRGNAQVSDFGLSMILAKCDSSSCETYYPGSIRWAAPELIDLADEEVGEPTTCSDVYSLGSVILHVLSGKLPFHWLEDPIHIMAARHQGMQPMVADSSVDRCHVPFLQECWSRSSDRPTIDHALSYIEVYCHRNNCG